MSEQPEGVGERAEGEIPPAEPATVVAVVAGFAGVMLLCVALLLPVPYVVLSPGPVLNTLGSSGGKPLISVSGHRTYPTTGELDLTTVSSLGGPGRRVSLLQAASAWFAARSTVVPEEVYFPPGQTAEETRKLDQASMVDSQESASVAALEALGIDVPADLAIAGVRPGAPSAKAFVYGDVIRTVAGRPIRSLEQLRSVLAGVKSGATVPVELVRDGKLLAVQAVTSTETGTGRTVLDVYVDQRFDLPFEVTIQIENIGGPSAGQMFALGLIDTLTPGDLTGGKRIAGTGTIDPTGAIGPIGGIRQKLIGAREAGAQYFLAPAENCAEVVGHVPAGLRVVRTENLRQSRAEVQKIATGQVDTLPTCT